MHRGTARPRSTLPTAGRPCPSGASACPRPAETALSPLCPSRRGARPTPNLPTPSRSSQAPRDALGTMQHLWCKQCTAALPPRTPDTGLIPRPGCAGLLGQSPPSCCFSRGWWFPKSLPEHRTNPAATIPILITPRSARAAPARQPGWEGESRRAGPSSSPRASCWHGPSPCCHISARGRLVRASPAGHGSAGPLAAPAPSDTLDPFDATQLARRSFPRLPAYPPCSSRDRSPAGLQPRCDPALFLETLNPASPRPGQQQPQHPPSSRQPGQLRGSPRVAPHHGVPRMLRLAEPRLCPQQRLAPATRSFPPSRGHRCLCDSPSSAAGSRSQTPAASPVPAAGSCLPEGTDPSRHAQTRGQAQAWVPSPSPQPHG